MDILSYQLDTEQQFWEELDDLSSKDYHSTSTIERILAAYIRFAVSYMDSYLAKDEDLTRCAQALIRSSVFSKNRAYVRRTLISQLVLEEPDLRTKILIGAVLLLDGRLHQSTLEMMHEEKATGPIISILWKDRYTNIRLHRIYLELLYDLCRVQRLGTTELCQINEQFIEYILSVIQNQVDYDNDPYGLAAMKVILALNEQYMIAALTTYDGTRIENRCFKVLKEKGNQFRTFGENLVFLLNRGPDRCLQLMSLKLLYLIFTTVDTYQYIYLNDLKVLVSVMVRELCDLPPDEETLRHTYLRILYPLLQNTQIREDGYRKRELVDLLTTIADPESSSVAPFGEETRRLASRCLTVDWLEYSFPCTPLSSPHDEDSSSDDSKKFLKPPVPKKTRPPAPGPRKLRAMTVRSTSETDIATVRKVPPPPPPRSRSSTPSVPPNGCRIDRFGLLG